MVCRPVLTKSWSVCVSVSGRATHWSSNLAARAGDAALPAYIGQIAEHAAHPVAPLTAERGEIRIARVEAPPPIQLELILLVLDEIDRHGNAQVAAHGGVERHQDAFTGVRQAGARVDHAIDDWFAVLGFTGLKERRARAGLDEIAFGIGAKQPRRFAFDLPADDERSVEFEVAPFEVRAISIAHVANCVGDYGHEIEHRAHGPHVRFSVVRTRAL